MIYGDKCYVLMQNMYRYGWDPKPEHLPNSADINKQITYGSILNKQDACPMRNYIMLS